MLENEYIQIKSNIQQILYLLFSSVMYAALLLAICRRISLKTRSSNRVSKLLSRSMKVLEKLPVNSWVNRLLKDGKMRYSTRLAQQIICWKL